jgi:hypothetical protein
VRSDRDRGRKVTQTVVRESKAALQQNQVESSFLKTVLKLQLWTVNRRDLSAFYRLYSDSASSRDDLVLDKIFES